MVPGGATGYAFLSSRELAACPTLVGTAPGDAAPLAASAPPPLCVQQCLDANRRAYRRRWVRHCEFAENVGNCEDFCATDYRVCLRTRCGEPEGSGPSDSVITLQD